MGNDMGLTVELARRTKRRGRIIAHLDDGFPHYSSSNGMCMCLQKCCQDESGCIDPTCKCVTGRYAHGETLSFQEEKSATLEKGRTQRDSPTRGKGGIDE